MASAPRLPLARVHWLILGFWLLVAVIFTVMSLVSSQGSTGWEGLIAILAIIFLVFAVAALVVVWALARYLISDDTTRTVMLVLGPPAMVTLLIFALRFLD